jgi:hypothetical protein
MATQFLQNQKQNQIYTQKEMNIRNRNLIEMFEVQSDIHNSMLRTYDF